MADIINVMPDAIVVVDQAGVIVFANNATRDLLGYAPEELLGNPLDCLIPAEFRDAHKRHFARFVKVGKPMAMGARPILSALHKTGRHLPISISISNLDMDDKRYSVAVMRDSRELHSEITEARAIAVTDNLTGIGNRRRLEQAVQAALKEGRPFGLLFLDLKNFKPFNDDHGHEVGDRVLQIIARRLQSHIRGGDLVVRLGGDEFVVMLDGLDQPGMLGERASALARSLARKFVIGDLEARVEVNIGGAIYPRDGDTMDALIRSADRNMYRAKKNGVEYLDE